MLHIDPAQSLVKTPFQVLQSALNALNKYIDKNTQKIVKNKSYRHDDISAIAGAIYRYFKMEKPAWLDEKPLLDRSIMPLPMPTNYKVESESVQAIKFAWVINQIKRRLASLSKGAYRKSDLNDKLQAVLEAADLTLAHLTEVIKAQATDNFIARLDYQTAAALAKTSDAWHCKISGESASKHAFFQPTRPLLTKRKVLLYTRDLKQVNEPNMNYIDILNRCFLSSTLMDATTTIDKLGVKFEAILIKLDEDVAKYLPSGKFLYLTMEVGLRKQPRNNYKPDPDLTCKAVLYKGEKTSRALSSEQIEEYKVKYDLTISGLKILEQSSPKLAGPTS